MGSRNIMDGGARGVNSGGERATGKEKSGERPAGIDRARLGEGLDECEKRAIETVAVSLAAD
jgi:hypothetical protein